MMAESRDFRVATYSVVSLITEFPLQATPNVERANASKSTTADGKCAVCPARSSEAKSILISLFPIAIVGTTATSKYQHQEKLTSREFRSKNVKLHNVALDSKRLKKLSRICFLTGGDFLHTLRTWL